MVDLWSSQPSEIVYKILLELECGSILNYCSVNREALEYVMTTFLLDGEIRS